MGFKEKLGEVTVSVLNLGRVRRAIVQEVSQEGWVRMWDEETEEEFVEFFNPDNPLEEPPTEGQSIIIGEYFCWTPKDSS